MAVKPTLVTCPRCKGAGTRKGYLFEHPLRTIGLPLTYLMSWLEKWWDRLLVTHDCNACDKTGKVDKDWIEP